MTDYTAGLPEHQLAAFAARHRTTQKYLKRLRECENAGIPFTIAEQFPEDLRHPPLALVRSNGRPVGGVA